jgi:hypothetical protein
VKEQIKQEYKVFRESRLFWVIVVLLIIAFFLLFVAPSTVANVIYLSQDSKEAQPVEEVQTPEVPEPPKLNTEDYDRRMTLLANNPPQPGPIVKKVKNKDGTITETTTQPPPRIDKWPAKTVYPNAGALLPFHRIVAYYGNLYSKKMGVLGEYSEDVMLEKLQTEAAKWTAADPETPVILALHYIAVVAQGAPGESGKYRARMPDSEIDKVIKMADKVHAIVFLDVQVALSNLQTEVPLLEKYLKMPNVHLGIDPEFSMKTGVKPGKVVGTMDGEQDVNFVVNYLSKLVRDNNLTPKVLIVHRYTQKMLTHSAQIKPTPEVQVVINMDGWGGKEHKISTYKNFIYPEPVQFAGFKIFYKNDVKEPKTKVFEPSELLKLRPKPIYIQYQ